jgi:hypothetical protein
VLDEHGRAAGGAGEAGGQQVRPLQPRDRYHVFVERPGCWAPYHGCGLPCSVLIPRVAGRATGDGGERCIRHTRQRHLGSAGAVTPNHTDTGIAFRPMLEQGPVSICPSHLVTVQAASRASGAVTRLAWHIKELCGGVKDLVFGMLGRIIRGSPCMITSLAAEQSRADDHQHEPVRFLQGTARGSG